MYVFGSRRRGGGELMRGLGLGFTNPVGTGGVGRVSVFSLPWCRWGVGRWLGTGSGKGWCYVCVSCESGLFVQMAGPGICILCLADTCASYRFCLDITRFYEEQHHPSSGCRWLACLKNGKSGCGRVVSTQL